jgi:hypothetical protein
LVQPSSPLATALAQHGQAVEVVGQALELPVAVLREAQRLRGVELESGVAEFPIQVPALHFGEPQHGAFAGAVAGCQGFAQGGIDPRCGLVRGKGG